MSAFDLSVFPSLWEGTPITAFEALAMGKPIVATDADGLLDILTDGHDAIIVPRRDVGALASTLVRVIDAPAERARLSSNARVTGREYDILAFVRKMERLYEMLHDAAQRRPAARTRRRRPLVPLVGTNQAMNQAGRTSHRGAAVLGLILFAIASAVAVSVDVPRTSYGLKSDESTYVAAALSAAYDGDLSFSRRDLERFAGLYHSGPDGIFLKRGKLMRIRVRAPFPYVHVSTRQDPDVSRLYFGKALVYPLVAAPFVRVFGLNGILLSHVCMLALCGIAAYLFLVAQGPPLRALTLTTAFFGASVLPVYSVFLMPEVFNFTLVLLAYFLWLYKEVAPGSALDRPWTDLRRGAAARNLHLLEAAADGGARGAAGAAAMAAAPLGARLPSRERSR